MPNMNRFIEKAKKRLPLINKSFYSQYIYERLRIKDITLDEFRREFNSKTKVINPQKDKESQISRLIDELDILDISNDTFFYSLDPYKVAVSSRGTTIFDNFTPNYSRVLFGCIDKNDPLAPALGRYIERATLNANENHLERLGDLRDIFSLPPKSFVDALQRILFINQMFWQTEHTLVGLGHLDWWLIDFYNNDVSKGLIDQDRAKDVIKDFMRAAHSNYEYKSNSLIGDTGQIIVLGGNSSDGYKSNELTYLFIEALKELHLPDPKILLRCGNGIPDGLFQLAVDCIASGIGSPLLSNDEVVIPAMIGYGYGKDDAFNYGVSACWEPLIIGISFDNNNCSTINFAAPLSKTINDDRFILCNSFEDIYDIYHEYLVEHIQLIVKAAQARVYDYDPLNNMLNDNKKEKNLDFCRGGADYNNTGFTSVGMSTVVNSFLNIEKYAFRNKTCTLTDIQSACKHNYEGYENLQNLFRNSVPRFGSDSEEVLKITNRIMEDASSKLSKYKTQYGGGFKIGFSSPNYINMGGITQATPDGRSENMPFATHISCDYGVSYTELMNFAAQLKYNENCFNGNVVDFLVSESLIRNNPRKFAILLRRALDSGIFQTQVNIIDSKIMIDAQKHPENYKNLIVRVWGFSAFFNDLPKDYQDNLIRRAIDAERAA